MVEDTADKLCIRRWAVSLGRISCVWKVIRSEKLQAGPAWFSVPVQRWDMPENKYAEEEGRAMSEEYP